MSDPSTTTTETPTTEKPKEEKKEEVSWNGPKSQADLDAIVNDRLARERKKYEGFSELKSKAEKFDELEQAQKSELERATAERDKWKSDAEKASEKVKSTFLRAAVIEAASKHQAIEPSTVYLLLDKDGLEVGDDGKVVGVDDAVAALLSSKPYLKGSRIQNMGNADGGVQGGQGTTPTTFSRSQLRDPTFYEKNKDAILKAYKAGQITDD